MSKNIANWFISIVHPCSVRQELSSDTPHAGIGQEMTSQSRFELSMSATGIFTLHESFPESS